MFDELIALLDSGSAGRVVCWPGPGRPGVRRGRLVDDVAAAAGVIAAATREAPAHHSVWVPVRDPYQHLVATLGCLRTRSAALVEAGGPAAAFDRLAALSPPALVVCDGGDCDAARWARGRGVPVYQPGSWAETAAHPPPAARPDVAVQFFTSGTTGPPKCVGVGAPQMLAAVRGVGGRLALTADDTSLAIAPLTHTLGFVTTVLAALAAGGAAVFADPLRSAEIADAVATRQPTWCAASPAAHRLLRRAVSVAGLDWPALRLLRSSAAPMPDDLADDLENQFGVPLVNAYVMTEAPGEIASQGLSTDRRRGTVGRPSLCEVRIGPDGQVPAGVPGEIWIRGPNVVPRGPARPGQWQATGDVGVLDEAGLLRVTGRNDDVINKGGLKVWPPDVEAAALRHPQVGGAVAFPVPHRALGEAVGLAVVPRAGRSIDRAAVRRLLMSELPRDQWPNTIVVWDRIPLTPRGKLDRRGLWRLLDGKGAA